MLELCAERRMAIGLGASSFAAEAQTAASKATNTIFNNLKIT
jgi:hypothetical protein